MRTGANQHTRSALGTTVDLKLSPRDRLAFAFQYSDLAVTIHHNALAFNVNRVLPGQFTTTQTRGAVAAGSTVLSTSNNTRWDWTYMPSLLWRHDGAVWKGEAGAALARAHHWRNEPREGLFGSTTTQRTGLTVSFDDIFYLRPGAITVTDGTTGAAVDPFSLNGYAVTGANTGSDWTDDTRRTAYAKVSRDFFGKFPSR